MDCERGKVKHPATHLEIAQLADDTGRYVDRTYVCEEHFWGVRGYEARGADADCTKVTHQKL